MLGYKAAKAAAAMKGKKREAPVQIVTSSKEAEEEVPPLKRTYSMTLAHVIVPEATPLEIPTSSQVLSITHLHLQLYLKLKSLRAQPDHKRGFQTYKDRAWIGFWDVGLRYYWII